MEGSDRNNDNDSANAQNVELNLIIGNKKIQTNKMDER